MSREKPAPEGHPIQVVAHRTGVTGDLLRAWERRYQAVRPSRSRHGRRLYSETDIERVRMLRLATEAGRRISEVAHLSDGKLRRLVAEDEAARASAPPLSRKSARETSAGQRDAASHLEACLDAARRLDAPALESSLERSAVDLSLPVLLDQVVGPLLHALGDLWRDGAIRIAHEHLATSVIRTFLGSLKRAAAPGSAPLLIATTPAGQVHELGAVLASATALAEGWRALYLGPNLPAEEIAAAARESGCAAVALSLIHPVDDPLLPQEILRLRRLLPADTVLVAGGTGSAAYAKALDEAGAVRLPDLQALRKELESIRRRRAAG